jgi:hypothetical protein
VRTDDGGSRVFHRVHLTHVLLPVLLLQFAVGRCRVAAVTSGTRREGLRHRHTCPPAASVATVNANGQIEPWLFGGKLFVAPAGGSASAGFGQAMGLKSHFF